MNVFELYKKLRTNPEWRSGAPTGCDPFHFSFNDNGEIKLGCRQSLKLLHARDEVEMRRLLPLEVVDEFVTDERKSEILCQTTSK